MHKPSLEDEMVLAAQRSLILYGTAIPPDSDTVPHNARRKQDPSTAEAAAKLAFESMERFGHPIPPLAAMVPTMMHYCAYCDDMFDVRSHFGLTTKADGLTRINSCRIPRNMSKAERETRKPKKRPSRRGPYNRLSRSLLPRKKKK